MHTRTCTSPPKLKIVYESLMVMWSPLVLSSYNTLSSRPDIFSVYKIASNWLYLEPHGPVTGTYYYVVRTRTFSRYYSTIYVHVIHNVMN